MAESQKMIKIFKRVENPSDVDVGSCWFALSDNYLSLRSHFFSKLPFQYMELWIVHEYYGGEGNLYMVSQFDFSHSAFRIVNDLDVGDFRFSRAELEDYIDHVAISDDYLLTEFQFYNDLHKDEHEYYEASMEEKIAKYRASRE